METMLKFFKSEDFTCNLQNLWNSFYWVICSKLVDYFGSSWEWVTKLFSMSFFFVKVGKYLRFSNLSKKYRYQYELIVLYLGNKIFFVKCIFRTQACFQFFWCLTPVHMSNEFNFFRGLFSILLVILIILCIIGWMTIEPIERKALSNFWFVNGVVL